MKPLSLITHFAAAIIITILLFTVYAAAQYAYRSPANNAQIQATRDISDALGKIKSIAHLIPGGGIDTEKSRDFINANREDIITWQPKNDIHPVMLLINAPGEGFVASGQSLKETEMHNFSTMLVIAWITCMGILLVHLLLQEYYFKRIAKNNKIN